MVTDYTKELSTNCTISGTVTLSLSLSLSLLYTSVFPLIYSTTTEITAVTDKGINCATIKVHTTGKQETQFQNKSLHAQSSTSCTTWNVNNEWIINNQYSQNTKKANTGEYEREKNNSPWKAHSRMIRVLELIVFNFWLINLGDPKILPPPPLHPPIIFVFL